jgi:hypothetical protein
LAGNKELKNNMNGDLSGLWFFAAFFYNFCGKA